eukprot:NODE_5805_length_554_cov_174.841683.p3 GENE.NODE_5805_length_554_cov_174.841683~~NODE_5805_length_554_cov_174.841683.p3  ORF type:complete len:88 (-),score=17.55 NODE_5805_length_554_cov_174.841683:157-420(-)
MWRKGIAIGKNTAEYQWHLRVRTETDRGEPVLVTPDPTDRAVSKRSCKPNVQDWRVALKQQYVAAGHSIEDGLDFMLPTGAKVDEAD